MSEPSQWRPRPDPALADPERPGLRPHRHEPDHLYGWVFFQHQVWVDYWGNEQEIDSMAGDYVANVIHFCEERAERIAALLVAETAYQMLLRLTVLGEAPQPELADATAASLEAIEQGGNGPLLDWLHQLPLLRALDARLAATAH